jgi:hypothetical protein
MDPHLRALYNAAYTPELHRRYVERLETWLDVKIPFRIAETPLFLPRALREKLATAAREICEMICAPDLIAKMERAIPPSVDVPNRDALANCLQIDFAITRGTDGELEGKVVELQGFPSLYALMILQTEALAEELVKVPGLEGPWSLFYSGHDRSSFVAAFRRALLAGNDPEEVVLLDLDPPNQKTYADFVATRLLTGVEAVDPVEIEREGERLFRRKSGRRVPIKRIYNRIVFDELDARGTVLPFRFGEDLDVTWFPHPNWYWIWSKYTLPHLSHPAIPKARFLSELAAEGGWPRDLGRYVLKPLFSFAGGGVKVDPTEADLDAISEAARESWILQEKIEYAPALLTPDGHGVKAEVRMMFLRAPEQERPELVLNLVRLSRGKMLGVDHNKDFDWVGGSVGIWPAAEGSP